jgi:uncharacterized membrane protein HdeD (DUF308 family)
MANLLGVLFIVLGVIAIAEPMVAGLAIAVLAGWLLMFGGVAHAVAAFRGEGVGHVIWQSVLAALYLIGGFYFVTHPLLGLGSLTLFLAAILMLEAGVRIAAYFQVRSLAGSGWLLVNGLVTLLLGGMIWAQWPSSSVWAIGTLIGINLLMTGISLLTARAAIRRLTA